MRFLFVLALLGLVVTSLPGCGPAFVGAGYLVGQATGAGMKAATTPDQPAFIPPTVEVEEPAKAPPTS